MVTAEESGKQRDAAGDLSGMALRRAEPRVERARAGVGQPVDRLTRDIARIEPRLQLGQRLGHAQPGLGGARLGAIEFGWLAHGFGVRGASLPLPRTPRIAAMISTVPHTISVASAGPT